MKLTFLTHCLFIFSCCTSLYAQQPVHAKVFQYTEPRNGLTKLTQTLSVPEEDAGYTLVMPENGPPRALIVLFHSGRDTSSKGFEMRLYREAVKRQVACMYVTTGNRFDFLFEDTAFYQIDQYLQKASSEHDLPRDRMLFTGMSLAGTRAIKFGIWCLNGHSKFGHLPKAIAVCDAPLDFTRFWKQLDRSKRLQQHETAASEAEWVTAVLERNLGGTPTENLRAYQDYSPYCYELENGGNVGILQNIPFRAYTEPDVLWWIENRGNDYYSMNAVDAAAVVNQLKLLGNDKAELILTQNKGYHPDGKRHPHSWSIVDNGELVDWLLGQ